MWWKEEGSESQTAVTGSESLQGWWSGATVSTVRLKERGGLLGGRRGAGSQTEGSGIQGPVRSPTCHSPGPLRAGRKHGRSAGRAGRGTHGGWVGVRVHARGEGASLTLGWGVLLVGRPHHALRRRARVEVLRVHVGLQGYAAVHAA